MDNTLVSARVSKAKKERAKGVLSSIGATTSDLINSALDYVISAKELPSARSHDEAGAADFAAFVRKSTLDIPWETSGADAKPNGTAAEAEADADELFASGDYREFMRVERLRGYESLA